VFLQAKTRDVCVSRCMSYSTFVSGGGGVSTLVPMHYVKRSLQFDPMIVISVSHCGCNCFFEMKLLFYFGYTNKV
jgi:hypothetical protein